MRLVKMLVLAGLLPALLLLVRASSKRPASAGTPPPQTILQQTTSFLTDLLWLRVDEYWHVGDHDSCIRLLRLITDLDPQDTQAYGSAAWLLWSQGKDAIAIRVYREGIAANPDVYDMYYELGAYYWLHRHYAEAASWLRQAVQRNPPLYVKHMYAHSLRKAGKKAEAIAAWRQILAQHPDDAVAQRELEKLGGSAGMR